MGNTLGIKLRALIKRALTSGPMPIHQLMRTTGYSPGDPSHRGAFVKTLNELRREGVVETPVRFSLGNSVRMIEGSDDAQSEDNNSDA